MDKSGGWKKLRQTITDRKKFETGFLEANSITHKLINELNKL